MFLPFFVALKSRILETQVLSWIEQQVNLQLTGKLSLKFHFSS